MVHLRSITLHEIRLPLREPFVISSGVQHLRRIFLLELEDADGVTAWSECVAQEFPNYSAETIDTAWHAVSEWLGSIVLGKDVETSGVVALLNEHVRGHEMAKSSLEMGIWALEAEKSGRSLARLLGGIRERVPVGISLGIQANPSTLVEKVATCLDQGYQKIKLKIMPGADLDYVRAVRDEFGDAVPIAADANSAYRLSDLGSLQDLDELNLMMLEQPLQHDDLLRHADLQEKLATPICLDESISGIDRAEDMIRLRAGRIINVKPGRVGGFAVARAIHDLCSTNEMPVWCGGMLESGIGRAHNVALASLPNFSLPGDLSPSRRYWERDVVTPEWTMSERGEVDVPMDRTGIGVAVNRDRIDDLTERIHRIAA